MKVPRSLLILYVFSSACTASDWLAAPVADSPAVNQLRADGNACGPACLLDSFRAGSKKWRSSIAKIQGPSDTFRVKKIIMTHASRPSALDPTKRRWNGKAGINALDLVNMANEMRSERWMSTVSQEIFFKEGKETDQNLLKRVHKGLTTSLKKGLPPILHVRRVAWRAPKGSTTKSWLTLKRHYLVLTGLPSKLASGATSFAVTYHDPWGGLCCQGIVRIPDPSTAGMTTVIADFPKSKVGKSLVKKGEASALSLSSAMGLF